MNTDSSVYNEASWGETLQNYRRKTQSLPWEGTAPRPFYVTSQDVKRREREFDPIMNRYREDSKEEELQKRESSLEQAKLAKARERRNRIERKRNIVTNQPLDGEIMEPTRAEQYFSHGKKPKNSSLSWNLLSHYPSEEHAALSADPDHTEPYKAKTVTIRTRDGKLPVSHKKREFDILSQKYHENHKERSREDRRLLREQLSEKYWKTHVFDPLKARYFDPVEEGKRREREEERARNWGRDQFERLPEGVRTSEGNCFNLISHNVRNKQALDRYQARKERAINHRRGKAALEERLREEGVQALDRDEKRAIQRVSYDRWQKIDERRYNILDGSNKPLPSKPQVAPRPEGWQRLQTLSSSPVKQEGRQPSTSPIRNTKSEGKGEGRLGNAVSKVESVPLLDLNQTSQGAIRTGGL